MKFHLLGSLEVSEGTTSIDLGGVKQRAVLGYLLLHANQVVPNSRMLNALWDCQPPSTARKMVQNAVSAIRRMLAAAGPDCSAQLLTHAPGYQLRVEFENRTLYTRGNHAVSGFYYTAEARSKATGHTSLD